MHTQTDQHAHEKYTHSHPPKHTWSQIFNFRLEKNFDTQNHRFIIENKNCKRNSFNICFFYLLQTLKILTHIFQKYKIDTCAQEQLPLMQKHSLAGNWCKGSFKISYIGSLTGSGHRSKISFCQSVARRFYLSQAPFLKSLLLPCTTPSIPKWFPIQVQIHPDVA